jgi:hypothetical protein
MHARCWSVYSASLEQEATANATAIKTLQVRGVALWLIGSLRLSLSNSLDQLWVHTVWSGRRQPFGASDDGIAAGEPTECFNPVAVVMHAEALARKEGHVGAVAFSRTGDPATGDFSDATVLRKFGYVPDDLSAL